MIGKMIRLERIIDRNSGKTVIVPMDHGVSVGPIEGLEDMRAAVSKVVGGGANAILMHKGMVLAGHRGAGRDVGLIIHLSAGTSISPDPNAKELVCSVEEAIKLGADAVSVHIGPKIKNEFDVANVKLAARVGAELGADIVKVPYTGSVDTFAEVVGGCPVPVVIAGGEKMESDEDIFKMVDEALKAGAKGLSIGRNAFQHKSPEKIVSALCKMVHEAASVEKAIEMLQS